MDKKFFTTQQISNFTGLSVHTLRYYEKIGLLDKVKRDVNGYRQYTESDISWINFLIRLRVTGMPVSEMKQFSVLRSQGELTVGLRRGLLENHQKNVQEKIKDLQINLQKIEEKINYYKKLEVGD
ncbi:MULTISPECIES: MerR family transcriptional regulator [unclassified Niallia]|uniref:MerR family transcriptional regulator n=1 Tax=unclassified Niallia TaxID=2837522 RepID=UPI001ED9CAAC|nr:MULTISPECIES: MerR family transcriptional regulator [unclassified Niallia]MCM3034234.1 MerR family transcriptional regulator [Niallia sp. MER 6]UPO90100.1 MerR family transcriptional regulator [Niallia sp. Man26]